MMEGSDSAINIIEQAQSLGLAFICTLAVGYVAYKGGLFHYEGEKGPLPQKLPFGKVLGAFLSFLTAHLLIVPVVATTYFMLKTGGLPDQTALQMDDVARGWVNIAGMSLSFAVVAGYTLFQRKMIRSLIWKRSQEQGPERSLRNFIVGAAAWAVAYPSVFLVGHGLGLLIYLFTGRKEIEQVAVTALKTTQGEPVLFSAMAGCMVFLVPVLEELLFRGYLQTWLRGRMRLSYSIAVTSVIFALFHYSYSQGLSNIEYLFALMLLSGFLGYLYERQKSLWAPIGLHLIFNAISILIVVLS